MMKKIIQEKGSVTLFVLIACMFMIMVLLMVNIAVMNRNRSQERELEEIAKEYNQNETDLDNVYAKVVGENDYATVSEITNIIYSVGSIYITTNSQNPGEYLGGEWESFGEGKTLVGIDSSDSDFSTVEKTGGEKEIYLSNENLPERVALVIKVDNNIPSFSGIKWGAVGVNKNNFVLSTLWDFKANGQNIEYNKPINNLQPYITTYMWKRVS